MKRFIAAAEKADDAARAAQALYDLGLFQGTGNNADGTPNFDLGRTPTRAEAVTMLVRLLGKDAEAKAGSWTTPFTDVADWAKPYVGYAYTNGLTTGTSATTFGGEDPINVTQYLTFVLRALGYTSGTDFQWDSAWTKADEIGLTDGSYNANTAAFTRGDVATISESALGAERKGQNTTMLSELVTAGAVTKQAEQNYLHPPIKAQSISLSESNIDLTAGDSKTITATVLPSDTTDKTVTWTSSNPNAATVSDGKITAKGAGVTTITATTSNQKTATCTVTVANAPIVYSGTGDKVITGINIPFGSYYAEYTHNGDHNFISRLYYGDNSYDYFSIANEIGACAGQVALYQNGNASITDGMLEVKADGAWSIALKPVSGTTTTNIKGTGTRVTGIFTASSARNVVNTTYNGEHNFIVKVIKYNGTKSYDYKSVTNEIGNYSGQKVISLEVGEKYYVFVEADGDWTVDFGLGDSVTTYSSLNSSDSNSSNHSSDYNEKGEQKWSMTDATNLSKATQKASDATLNAYKACVEALKTPALNTLSYSRAVSEVKTARMYLGDAMRLCKNRAEIPFTDGSTMLSNIEAVDELLDTIDDISITSSNVDDYAGTLEDTCHTASQDMVKVMILVSKFMDAFK